MTRSSALLSLAVAMTLLSAACDKKKPVKKASELEAASEQPTPQDPAAPTASKSARATYSWKELQTWDIKEGISPPEAPPADEEPTVDAHSEAAALKFARVAGGENAFCGALRSGPIQCWGRSTALHKGAFVDVAMAKDAVCGLTAAGVVECSGLDDPLSLSGVKRIAGAGDDICALDGAGNLTCFTVGDGAPLSPPSGLKAKYFAVGFDFACAADKENKLRCWGDVAALNLPSENPVIRDVAAGSGFVCYLTEDSEINCLGQSPEVPEGRYKAVAAGYNELCVIDERRAATCTGSVEARFDAVERISVGLSAVCAVSEDGVVRCEGKDESSQLTVPVANLETFPHRGPASAIAKDAFAEFVSLFPEVKLPHAFDRTATFDLGDRLPMRFAKLVGGAANDYRTGIKIPQHSGAIAVTLLHMPTGSLELHTFTGKGQPVKFRTLAGRSHESGSIEEAADGTGVRTFTAKTVESVVTADGLVVTTTYEGSEVTHYVKEHIDGSRPVSRIACNITGTTSSDAIDKNGNFIRKSAAVLPPRSTTDTKGCQGAWPMGG